MSSVLSKNYSESTIVHDWNRGVQYSPASKFILFILEIRFHGSIQDEVLLTNLLTVNLTFFLTKGNLSG